MKIENVILELDQEVELFHKFLESDLKQKRFLDAIKYQAKMVQIRQIIKRLKQFNEAIDERSILLRFCNLLFDKKLIEEKLRKSLLQVIEDCTKS